MYDFVRRITKRLELRLRAIAPERIRTFYRALRSLEPVRPSRNPPAELLRDCRFCVSRIDMLDDLPHRGVVAELGTFKGDFAREILSRCHPRELHLIDVDYSRFDEAHLAEPCVKRHQGLTDQVIATFPDAYFDWIYVDADHSYAGVIKDALASAPKIRPGGFMVFNDFAFIDPQLGRYGVHRAVVDFCIDYRWPFHYFAFDGGAALYDVALQKPLE